jgi:hypothetical protein
MNLEHVSVRPMLAGVLQEPQRGHTSDTHLESVHNESPPIRCAWKGHIESSVRLDMTVGVIVGGRAMQGAWRGTFAPRICPHEETRESEKLLSCVHTGVL